MKLEEPGIAVHEFYAMAGEFARERDKVRRQQFALLILLVVAFGADAILKIIS
jgi:hypothetical protein